MDGFFPWMGSFAHPDQAGLRIVRNGNLSTTLRDCTVSTEKKHTPASNVKVWVCLFWSREEVLGIKPSPSTLRVVFCVLEAAPTGEKWDKSWDSAKLWDSKNGGGLFKKGILIIPIVSYKFLVRFPGF